MSLVLRLLKLRLLSAALLLSVELQASVVCGSHFGKYCEY